MSLYSWILFLKQWVLVPTTIAKFLQKKWREKEALKLTILRVKSCHMGSFFVHRQRRMNVNHSFSFEINFVVQYQEKNMYFCQQKLLTEEITYWNDPEQRQLHLNQTNFHLYIPSSAKGPSIWECLTHMGVYLSSLIHSL